MDLTPKDFHVGQRLWFVHGDQRRGAPRFVKVSKIGRKWVSLDFCNYRLDPETGWVDEPAMGSVGRIYLYKEDWENAQEANKLWCALMQITGHGYKPKSADVVREAAKALGVELPQEPPTE